MSKATDFYRYMTECMEKIRSTGDIRQLVVSVMPTQAEYMLECYRQGMPVLDLEIKIVGGKS
jgi:hypothetical protein